METIPADAPGDGISEGQCHPGPSQPPLIAPHTLSFLLRYSESFPCLSTNVQFPPGLVGGPGSEANTSCVSQSFHEEEAPSLERCFPYRLDCIWEE